MAELPCIFKLGEVWIFFFVDDIALLYPKRYQSTAYELRNKLFSRYEMKEIGELNWFLAVQITRDRPNRRLWLNQAQYCKQIFNRFINKDGIIPGRSPRTPLPLNSEIMPNEEQASPQEIYLYQQKIGSINFAAVTTRPDIAFAVSRLAEHLSNPSPMHQKLANHLICYLFATAELSLQLGTQSIDAPQLLASSDASFASHYSRKSIQGQVFQLYGGTIDWKANKQSTITLSSTEAELLALSDATKQLIWWRRVLSLVLNESLLNTPLQQDNEQTIRLIVNPEDKLNTKLKHVDIHRHWLRQEIKPAGSIQLRWTPSADTIADGLTKQLPIQRHNMLLQQLHLTYPECPAITSY